jgi:hypothetical protein
MGAWGEGAFDNDIAADWAWEFETADLEGGLRLITDALAAAAQTGDAAYLDARAGTVAVAAAELVASIDGSPIDESAYNETACQWIARARPASDADLTKLARRALSRVTGQRSELADLWDEADSSWRSVIGELRVKLDG